jgi:hypothetical protein
MTHCQLAELAQEYSSLLQQMTVENSHATNARLCKIRTDASYLTPASPEGVRFLLTCIEIEVSSLAYNGTVERLPAILRMLAALAPQQDAAAA